MLRENDCVADPVLSSALDSTRDERTGVTLANVELTLTSKDTPNGFLGRNRKQVDKELSRLSTPAISTQRATLDDS